MTSSPHRTSPHTSNVHRFPRDCHQHYLLRFPRYGAVHCTRCVSRYRLLTQRPMLYPVELRALKLQARKKSRLVGAERFELPTLCSQSRCATRLRHAPMPDFPPRKGSLSRSLRGVRSYGCIAFQSSIYNGMAAFVELRYIAEPGSS